MIDATSMTISSMTDVSELDTMTSAYRAAMAVCRYAQDQEALAREREAALKAELAALLTDVLAVMWRAEISDDDAGPMHLFATEAQAIGMLGECDGSVYAVEIRRR